MEEIWKDVKGWEGKHQISNYGRIKTFNYMNRGKDVIREGFDNSKGYLKITFSKTQNPSLKHQPLLLLSHLEIENNSR